MKHVLIAGVSTRAAAESAARAGFTTTAIDAFADADQHPSVRALSPAGGYSPDSAARMALGIECDAVAYLAGFENHPEAVATLASGRALWGNPPAVLKRVRDPIELARMFAERGCAVPAVRRSPPAAPDGKRDWLVKPLAQGGGHGIRRWRPGLGLPDRAYLQERVEGTPGSVVFVAAAGRALPLGVSRQLIGEAAFGAAGYGYCGNILAGAGDQDAALLEGACRLASAAAEAFELVGVNGLDFVARGRVPYPVELNPRWCASMELVERAFGLSVFAAHAAACTTGVLPEFDLRRSKQGRRAVGKAVVFARRDVTAGDTRAWLEEALREGLGEQMGASIRDVPRPGERILSGRPVCTVFATGCDDAACHAALVRRAQRVCAELDRWEELERPVRITRMRGGPD